MQKTIPGLGLPPAVEKQLLQKLDRAIKLVTKDKKKQIISLINRYAAEIQTKKLKKTKTLTTEQRDIIVKMLTQLLDAIK